MIFHWYVHLHMYLLLIVSLNSLSEVCSDFLFLVVLLARRKKLYKHIHNLRETQAEKESYCKALVAVVVLELFSLLFTRPLLWSFLLVLMLEQFLIEWVEPNRKLRWLNTVFDTSVSFTYSSKTLDLLVAENGSKQVNNTNFNFLIIKLTYVSLPWQHD